uniref:Uncharacterized protein n=1 Tax=Sphingobacterium sp. (strain 21) TaxID=743722 RepID=F4C7R5_SPHS2
MKKTIDVSLLTLTALYVCSIPLYLYHLYADGITGESGFETFIYYKHLLFLFLFLLFDRYGMRLNVSMDAS